MTPTTREKIQTIRDLHERLTELVDWLTEAEHLLAVARHLLKAAAALQQADAVTTPTDNGKPKTKRRQDVTQSEAAQLCSVTAKTVQRWDKGEGTPSGYPGRQDAVTLRAWAARRKEAANVKRSILAGCTANMDTMSGTTPPA